MEKLPRIHSFVNTLNMRNGIRLILIIPVILLSTPASFAQIDYKGFPQWSWHKQDSTEYYLYMPSDIQPGKQYPIALFMHGCCGPDDHASLRNAVDPPARMWHNFGANTQKTPTYIIAPATSRGWERHFDNLKKVMDDLVKTGQADPQRIYVCGFSMGGGGAFKFISRYPRYFAAAIIMGMEMKGDLEKVKDVPIWINRGETDWYSRNMPQQVAQMRKLNGAVEDTGYSWVTGINPRFSDFKDVGHGVQWLAASTQDLTDWAYSRINDGNLYPHVWFPGLQWKTTVKKGTTIKVNVGANDPDGSISKIDIYLNKQPFKRLQAPPFAFSFTPGVGDNVLEAVAHDNKGKTSTATAIIQTDIPSTIITTQLPYARQGALYTKQLAANGNGAILWTLKNGSVLPNGLSLSSAGLIGGIAESGSIYNFDICAKDEDGDSSVLSYTLNVLDKRPGEVLVTHAVNNAGISFPVSKMRKGALPFFNRDDNEINFSEVGAYEGLTYIAGKNGDTTRSTANYLSFNTDEDAMIYVAYEKLDNLYSSTIPQWLKQFKKQPSTQIAAQYFYYDLYYKAFPKGKITLPAADEKGNGTNTSYFVLIKPLIPVYINPEINTTIVSTAFAQNHYKEQLTTLYGKGEITWTLKKGKLPTGILLSAKGTLSGTAKTKGSYRFIVEAKDESSNTAERELVLLIK